MADEENNPPFGANDEPRFEPPSHLKELAAQRRPFGFGEGVYEEETGTSWPAAAEDVAEEAAEPDFVDVANTYEERRARELALENALKGLHGDAHHDEVITRAEAFHRFLTGKAAD